MRSALTIAVLASIRPGRTYGYAISSTLHGAGLGAVKGGTLYPLLGRLERDGLIAATWAAGDAGPGRKYFELTSFGRKRLDELVADWSEFSARVSALAGVSSLPTEA